MLLSEIKDQINLLSRLEYMKTKRQVIEFPDKELAFLISSTQQDIQRRLSVVTTSYTITLDGSDSYLLPKNFGTQILAMLGGIKLEEKDFYTVKSYTNPEGNWYAIQTGNRSRLLTGATTGSIVLYYYPDLNYYQPSLSSTQDWGTFTGVVFTGYPILPDRYDMALIYGVLKFIFPEYYPQYEKELRSLRESRVFSGGDTLGYNLGNVDDFRERLHSTTTVTSEVTVPTDQPTKRIRFNVTDNGSDAVESFQEGFNDEPTYVNNTSTIVVESDDFLTTNYIHVEFSNDDWTWGLSGNQITLTPPTDTSWGTCEIIIEIW